MPYLFDRLQMNLTVSCVFACDRMSVERSYIIFPIFHACWLPVNLVSTSHQRIYYMGMGIGNVNQRIFG